MTTHCVGVLESVLHPPLQRLMTDVRPSRWLSYNQKPSPSAVRQYTEGLAAAGTQQVASCIQKKFTKDISCSFLPHFTGQIHLASTRPENL